jgi:hypothetical protein
VLRRLLSLAPLRPVEALTVIGAGVGLAVISVAAQVSVAETAVAFVLILRAPGRDRPPDGASRPR